MFMMANRKTRNSRRVIHCANKAKRKSRDILLDKLCNGLFDAFKKNGNKLPYKHMSNLLKEVQPGNNWMTRNTLNKAFIKYKRSQLVKHDGCANPAEIPPATTVGLVETSTISLLSDLSNVSSKASSNSRSVGRPAGTTIIQKKTEDMRLIAAKNEIAEKYKNVKVIAAKKRTRVKPGSLSQIIQSVKAMRRVTVTISPQAIRRQIHRKSLVTHHIWRASDTTAKN